MNHLSSNLARIRTTQGQFRVYSLQQRATEPRALAPFKRLLQSPSLQQQQREAVAVALALVNRSSCKLARYSGELFAGVVS
jgi:hypothetical protein